MLKKALFLFFLPCFAVAQEQGYVDPLSFGGSEAEKERVIAYIKRSVYQSTCRGAGECSPEFLRRMGQGELDSFKFLVANAKKNKEVFLQVHHDYCVMLGQCSYSWLQMVFEGANMQLTW